MKSHIFNYRFYLWNPATNTKSAEFGSFDQQYNPRHLFDREMLTFGCDIFTGTYKIVASLPEQDVSVDYHDRICHVRVLSLGDNFWRNINSFPLTPLISDYNNGVHLSGTVSWLAIREYNIPVYKNIYIEHVEQFMIVSLNLSTETYTQFLLPSSFDQVPHFEPTLQVLMDCLCFSHDFNKTEFVIWQMKDFGVQESWTQLFRIGYLNLEMTIPIGRHTPLLPVYHSKNGDTLILAHCIYDQDQAIIYEQRENRIDRIRNSNGVGLFSYIESLVSPHWK
jgi:F-box interacting protein